MGGGDKPSTTATTQLAPMPAMPAPSNLGSIEETTMGATKPAGAYLPIEEPENDYFQSLMNSLYQRLKAREINEGSEIPGEEMGELSSYNYPQYG